ncbi:MAG: efflux RND transporter periplasmic adaptor subunit [Pseudomonadota bacterium]
MNTRQKTSIAVIIIVAALLAALILMVDKPAPAGDDHAVQAEASHGHDDEKAHADAEAGHKEAADHTDTGHPESAAFKGPHGGQLFTKDDVSIEMVLAEEGGSARFLAYLNKGGKPLAPAAGQVSVTLARPDGSKQDIPFVPEKEALKSTLPIPEPHVFEATITAQVGNAQHVFTFSQQEGKIALSDAQMRSSGVTVQTAGPAHIRNSAQFPGEIKFNEDRTAHVVPRFAGVVESVQASLGQPVKKGQVIAVITSGDVSEQRSALMTAQQRLALAQITHAREKKLWEEKISAQQDYQQAQQALREAEIATRNAQQKLNALGAGGATQGALSRYAIRAPFDGMVVEKHIALGESVKEDANVFTISDLSTVWAEIAVPANQLILVRVGADASVKATAFDAQTGGKVSYVGALLGEQTRTAKARIVLANPQGAWRPGLFVNVDINAGDADVPVAVAADAIQTVNDKTVVFLRVPGGFIAQPVTTGRSDGKQVEIVKGLQPGAQYAGAGSFVVKSELGKASAEHTH